MFCHTSTTWKVLLLVLPIVAQIIPTAPADAVPSPATAAKSVAPKNLKISSPTGTYERPGADNPATLKIMKLSSNQIKFDLIAENGPNSGEAAGTITLTNNRGIYKGDNFQLVFTYGGKTFNVQQTGDGQFGGMSVRADGLYNKTSGATPNIPN
ncbi:MAG TPA: hypothetical protein V6C81_13735 [Planktothrix sp.]|jgi:hypothetical protein